MKFQRPPIGQGIAFHNNIQKVVTENPVVIMASGKHIPCGPCMFDDVSKDAGRWCTNCEEGLCENCETSHRKSKTSRNHKVITIEDYRKIEHVSISQVCEHHGENLEWFCNNHDEVLCVACVPSKHKTCSDVIPISANSANSRQSSALSDLEETIQGTLCNLKQCIKNRESATKEIDKQEMAVKTLVLETRTKINVKLDKLEEKLLHELRSASLTCKSKVMTTLQKLESTEEKLTKFREQTLHMKEFSSDIQVFLGTRQACKLIESEVKSIKNEIDASKDFELKLTIHTVIEKLSNQVEDFGQIKISECSTKLAIREKKIDQAQIGINVLTSSNISNIKLQLIKAFQMTSVYEHDELNISSCIILPNGNLLMANDTTRNYLIEYSNAGDHIRDIPVSGRPYDIAVIDLDHIVVTYGDTYFVEILHTNTFNVEKKISLRKSCLGVSHADGKLYVVHGRSIQVLDLSGRQLTTMKTVSLSATRITTSNDKIVYSDWKNSKVHCCHLNGEELWQFENDNIDFPTDITADDHNNVFVLSYISNNLTIVQHDGKNSKTLLTESDGLLQPRAVFYDKGNRTLIENIAISQVCEHHGENLEWFCKSHDEVLCVVCVPSKHKACSDVIPISVNSANARQSTTLSDLEESIDGTLSNLTQCIKNRESAQNEIENQEIAVKIMILETRTNINHHLDRLQEKLLQELRSTTETCKSKYTEIVQKLKSKEEMLTKQKEQTIHMKQFSSDIQVFLGTLQMNKRIESEIKSIKSELCSAKDYKLKVAFHTLIEKLNRAEEFGHINVSECATMLELREQKIDQSQIMVSHGDGKLYVVYENDIQVMDLSGRQLKTLKTAANGLACIKTSRDKIFYADNTTNQVHCCRLNGEELWKFECDLIEFPHDITVDSYKNVYVVGYSSNNLTIIQHDGKYSETLLTESDDLYHPTAVDFDTDKRTLLICNEEGKIALYKVV
ncbi:unnamed protein product [Mytilus edulis]|uniref:B box-type domain-containing protein n=1 Tax=Mytilus edulis TaxID=6550 RepID=A0A8S3SVR7_MYTED|nr:unnamed protein product [Mytilus edulis]